MKVVILLLGLAMIGAASASGLAAYDSWKGGWSPYALSYAGGLGWKGGLGYGAWNTPIGLGWKGLGNYKYAPHYAGYGLGGVSGLYGLGYGYGSALDLPHSDYLYPWY